MPQANGHATLAPTGPLTPDKRKAIAAWLKDDAAPLHGYCSKLAAEQLGGDASPVQLADGARVLFEAARERFGF